MSEYKITINEEAHQLKAADLNDLDIVETGENQFHILQDGIAYQAELVQADYANKTMIIAINGNKYELAMEDEYDLLVKKMGLSSASTQKIKDVKAPMPGLVLDVLVTADQAVSKGDALLILEAMKMENVLKAEGDGVIKSIEVTKGTAVEKGQVIIEMQ